MNKLLLLLDMFLKKNGKGEGGTRVIGKHVEIRDGDWLGDLAAFGMKNVPLTDRGGKIPLIKKIIHEIKNAQDLKSGYNAADRLANEIEELERQNIDTLIDVPNVKFFPQNGRGYIWGYTIGTQLISTNHPQQSIDSAKASTNKRIKEMGMDDSNEVKRK